VVTLTIASTAISRPREIPSAEAGVWGTVGGEAEADVAIRREIEAPRPDHIPRIG